MDKTLSTKQKNGYSAKPALKRNKKNSFFGFSGFGDSFFSSHSVQLKLKIGQPGDKYEQEADRVADAVMRMPESQVQRQPISDDEEKLQKKAEVKTLRSGEYAAPSKLTNEIKSQTGSGSLLPKNIQSEMGQKIGADFSGVKIHTDSKSIQMNQELGAKAFTHGSDIFFNEGQYNPGSGRGKHLLAHELTHVVQQTGIIRRQSNNKKMKSSTASKKQTKSKGKVDFIKYTITANYSKQGLGESNLKGSINTLTNTEVGQKVLKDLEKKKIHVTVIFTADSSEFPGSVGTEAGFFKEVSKNKYEAWVEAGTKSSIQIHRGSQRLTNSGYTAKDRKKVARTLFHELLHIWFVNQPQYKGQGFPTGHSAKVKPEQVIGASRIYDEKQYHKKFLEMLKKFDSQVQ